MLQNILQNISFISTLLGNFFLFSSIIGFMRYKDFYIKLHTVSMFNIYGINFILFAIASNSYDPIIFFEMLILIIVNTLCTLCVIHCFIRNAILNGIEYVAKTRDDVIREKTNRLKQQVLKEQISNTQQKEKAKERERKIEERRIERERKEEEKRIEKQKRKEAKELEKIKKEEEKKQKDKKETPQLNKKEVNRKIETKSAQKSETPKVQTQKVVHPTKPIQPTPTTNNNVVNNDMSEEERKIKEENDDLKNKIKEQKKILRKKIETARKKAFITRKPEEIEKTEKMIQDILNKYNLTEDMLKDEDED